MNNFINRLIPCLSRMKKPNHNIDKDDPTQKIINVVKDYLTRETNNALLITGKWGVGKTYFFNNILSGKIEKTSIKGDANSTYTPIRVSLFGVANIDDIGRRIFTELFPRLEKGIKIGKGIAKLLLSIPITKVFIPDKIPELISEFEADNETKNNIIISKANTLVICFDDLERLSKDFHIEDLIGYINNLTENYDFKVILIGNTDEIKDNNFKEIKEKLIGVEIEFDNDDIKPVFDNIVKNKFHEDESNTNTYKNFLEEKKDFICSFFNKDYKNIRTLLIVLECYKHIYSAITHLDSEPLEQYKDDLIKSTLLFTIAIVIEFKKGKLTKKNKDELNDDVLLLLEIEENVLTLTSSNTNTSLNEEKESRIIKNVIKYYNNQQTYFFYESIFDYIIGINTFIKDTFVEEVKKKYGMSEDEKIPECYEVYNKINSDYILQISNKKYIELLNEVLQYVDEGKYHLESYGGIYIDIIKYNNPLEIDKETLKNRIIDGIKKGKNNFEYNPELPNKLLYSEDPDIDENIKEIVHFCININKEKEKEKYKKEAKDLINDLNNNFDHFEHKVKRKYNNIPIFAYINSKTISDFYYNNIPLREKISDLIKERAILVEEKEFYSHLQQSIKEKEEELQSGPEWYSYNKFNKLLKKIIDIAK